MYFSSLLILANVMAETCYHVDISCSSLLSRESGDSFETFIGQIHFLLHVLPSRTFSSVSIGLSFCSYQLKEFLAY